MQKTNEGGGKTSTILIPENGSITLMNESGDKLKITNKKFGLLHEMVRHDGGKEYLEALSEGFIEIFRYKMIVDKDNEMMLSDEFMMFFTSMLDFYKYWSKADKEVQHEEA